MTTTCEDCDNMTHATTAHGTMQLLAGQVRKGYQIDTQDGYSLRVIRAYCEAILEGGSVEPDEIYHRAFGETP